VGRDPNRRGRNELWLVVPVVILVFVGASLTQSGGSGISVRPLGVAAAPAAAVETGNLVSNSPLPVATFTCVACVSPTPAPI
jgi:hypothetical protein